MRYYLLGFIPLFCLSQVFAFSGLISSSTTWTTDQIITGTVTVEATAILTIEKGVRVKFVKIDGNADGKGDSKFIVKGQLICRGTSDSIISFESYESLHNKTDWQGIDIQNTGAKSSLYNTRIMHADTAIRVKRDFQISSSYIENCKTGIVINDGTISIDSSSIANCQQTAITILNNSICSLDYVNLSNNNAGILTDTISDKLLSISNSIISQNDSLGVDVLSGIMNMSSSSIKGNIFRIARTTSCSLTYSSFELSPVCILNNSFIVANNNNFTGFRNSTVKDTMFCCWSRNVDPTLPVIFSFKWYDNWSRQYYGRWIYKGRNDSVNGYAASYDPLDSTVTRIISSKVSGISGSMSSVYPGIFKYLTYVNSLSRNDIVQCDFTNNWWGQITGIDTLVWRKYKPNSVIYSGQLTENVSTAGATVQIPVAVLANNYSVAGRKKIILDGSQSTDPKNRILSYQWTRIDNISKSITLSANNSTMAATPFFYPDTVGTYIFTLRVFNGVFWSQPDTISINVSNLKPRIQTSTLIAWNKLQTNRYFPSSLSDPDGDSIRITYPVKPSWTEMLGDTLIGTPMLAATDTQFTIKVSDGIFDTSVVINISLTTPTPHAPNLLLPTNNAQQQPTSIALSWDTVNIASSYSVQISTEASFATTLINQSGLTANSYISNGLSHGTVYYWRVKGQNTGGAGAWSPTWSFTTIIANPAIPTPILPTQNAFNQSLSLILKWRSSLRAINYRLQVAYDSLFSSAIKDSTGIIDTSYSLTGLSNNTRYFWQVMAQNDGGPSAWSTVFSFRTIIAAPEIPAIQNPVNGATAIVLPAIVTWNTTLRATSYRFQIARDTSFATIVKDSSGILDTSLTLSSLSLGTKYFMRVNASNVGGISTWSLINSFTTYTTAIELTKTLPDEFDLIGNSPNPFNPNTTISYAVPKSSTKLQVNISIYDLQGKLVRGLVSSRMSQGNYTINWNGRDNGGQLVPTGLYIYSMSAAGYKKIKTMLLVK